MAAEPEVRVRGRKVRVTQGRTTLAEAPLAALRRALARSEIHEPSCGVLPPGVRVWWERGAAVALAIEVAPHARSVRWVCDDSPAPFGPTARYRDAFLAFPYVLILLVLRNGQLTGLQQLYYRTAPLDAGEELLLPNLLNVASGYDQRCWVCLAQLDSLGPLPWPAKIGAVVEHVFSASFNRSSEEHEGNSYWGAMRDVDSRVASVDAWEDATRSNRFFPLELAWKSAGTTLRAELRAMLDRASPTRSLETASDLAGLVTGGGAERGRS